MKRELIALILALFILSAPVTALTDAPQSDVDRIEVTVGDSTLNYDQTTAYTVTVHYDNGTSEDVTNVADVTVSSGLSHDDVANEVTATSGGQTIETITAEYEGLVTTTTAATTTYGPFVGYADGDSTTITKEKETTNDIVEFIGYGSTTFAPGYFDGFETYATGNVLYSDADNQYTWYAQTGIGESYYPEIQTTDPYNGTQHVNFHSTSYVFGYNSSFNDSSGWVDGQNASVWFKPTDMTDFEAMLIVDSAQEGVVMYSESGGQKIGYGAKGGNGATDVRWANISSGWNKMVVQNKPDSTIDVWIYNQSGLQHSFENFTSSSIEPSAIGMMGVTDSNIPDVYFDDLRVEEATVGDYTQDPTLSVNGTQVASYDGALTDGQSVNVTVNQNISDGPKELTIGLSNNIVDWNYKVGSSIVGENKTFTNSTDVESAAAQPVSMRLEVPEEIGYNRTESYSVYVTFENDSELEKTGASAVTSSDTSILTVDETNSSLVTSNVSGIVTLNATYDTLNTSQSVTVAETQVSDCGLIGSGCMIAIASDWTYLFIFGALLIGSFATRLFGDMAGLGTTTSMLFIGWVPQATQGGGPFISTWVLIAGIFWLIFIGMIKIE